jgi:hypothetical protein
VEPLYKRLGLRKSRIGLKFDMDRLDRLPQMMLNQPRDIDLYKQDFVSTTQWIALYHYYLSNLHEAKKYAGLMIDYTIEYFFGKWLAEAPLDGGPPDKERRKRYAAWTDEFREAVFWASCLGEWEKAERIAEYPTSECPVGRYEPKLFCYWCLLVAGVLRGESLESLSEYTETIAKSRRKYYTCLLNMLCAILEEDENRFNSYLAVYLDYCNENTFNRPEIDEKVSIDGTFLINYALHRGLKVEYPNQYRDRIVVLETNKTSPCSVGA